MKILKKMYTAIINSRTLLFNAIISGLLVLETSMSLLQPHMEANVFALASVILAVGNAALRTVTKKSLMGLK